MRISDDGKIDLKLPFRPICSECGPHYKILGKISKPKAEGYRGGRTEVFEAPKMEEPSTNRPQAYYSPEEKIFYKVEDGKKIPVGTWGEFAQELSDSNPAADPLEYSNDENDFSRLHQRIADSRTARLLEINAEKILDKTMRIDRLAATVWDWVVSMGWHNKTHLECLALISSEVGEAVNAWRDGDEDFHGELIDILFRTLDLLHNTNADIIVEVQKRLKRNQERGTRGREK
jgi:NTP pyrophosphatase (non-canonical NTP hydrolase)